MKIFPAKIPSDVLTSCFAVVLGALLQISAISLGSGSSWHTSGQHTAKQSRAARGEQRGKREKMLIKDV